jgi:hypothetical protein
VTRPPDDVPTTVLPQPTVEQPSVTTSPATRRSYTWHRRIPARIGRARSSTLVIGALFVLLGGLNALLPTRDTGMTPVVLPSGQTVSVPNSAIPSEARPTSTAPAPATREPASPTPAAPTETSAPPTSTDEETSAPPTRSSAAPTSTPSATRTTTSTRAPSTSAVPTATADEDEVTPARTAVPTALTGTADPTG